MRCAVVRCGEVWCSEVQSGVVVWCAMVHPGLVLGSRSDPVTPPHLVLARSETK